MSIAGVSVGALLFSVNDDGESWSGAVQGFVNSLDFGRTVVFLSLSSKCQTKSPSLSELIVICAPCFFVGRAG